MEEDYRIAEISADSIEKINSLQQTLKEQTGKEIILIAYTKDSET